MTGQIIEFRRHHAVRQASIHREQAAQTRLTLQIARITALLEELEDLTRGADGPTIPLLWHARSSIAEANRLLEPCADDDGDPQPDIDRTLLERLYRDLSP